MFQTNIRTHYFRNWFILPIFLVFCLLNVIIFNTESTHATSSSISLSISGSPTVIVASNDEGNFADSGDFTIDVTTTHASGYTLRFKAAGETNPTQLNGKNTEGHLVSIESAISANDFRDNSGYNDKWGYKPSVIYDKNANTTIANTNYLPSPSTEGDILDITQDSTDGSYTMSIGARVSTATAVDNYSNSFVFAVVGNPTPYTITYNANAGSDTVTNMPSPNPASGSASGETVTNAISSTVPVRDGYNFKGWCSTATSDATCSGTIYNPDGGGTSRDLTLNQQSSTNSFSIYAMWEQAGVGACPGEGTPGYICYDGNGATAGEMSNQSASASTSTMLRAYNYKRDGYGFLGWSTVANPTIGTDTIYGPMEDITTPSDLATKGLTLYAVWLPKSTTETMQSFTTSDCSSQLTAIIYNSSSETFTATPNSFIALEDTRDGNVYTVARMTDGFCWMLENLRLDESATSINTNALSQNGGSFTISQLPASTNSFTTTSYTTIQYNKNNTDINNSSLTPSYDANNNSSKWYGYGNYYSWAAARGTTSALDSGNTTTSICPANWRLPIGTNSTVNYSFGKLSTSMGGLSSSMASPTTPTGAVMSARLRHFPNNFVYSGSWYSTSAGDRGIYGYYWSSTAGNSYNAYYLYFFNSRVIPGTSGYDKYSGFSARCVAGS